MNSDLLGDLARRYDGLLAERSVAQQAWDEIERYVMPYRGGFYRDSKSESAVPWDENPDRESTAAMAHQNLAARLHGTVSNPAVRWFEIRFRDENLNKNKRVAEWLSDANERVYYALQDSNFNLEVNETYQDLCGFGTSAMFLESSPEDPLMFKSLWLKEFVFETDWRGTVLRFYRMLEMTPAEIISKFGAENVPDDIVQQDADGKREKHEVLFCIYPRNNKVAPIGKMQRSDRRPWAYCYFLKQSKEMLGKEGGYYEMPVFIPRWRKTNGSVWGNSPAHFCLGYMRALNEALTMHLEGSAKQIDPPTLANARALMTDLDMSSSALNVVQDIDGIKVWDTKFNFMVSDHLIDLLRDAIRECFFHDQLMLPAPQGTPATAYEVSVRYEQMQKLLGPTLGRLQNDLLDPIVSRVFRLLARNGQIPPPPAEVQEANAEFEVEYIGALSSAQKADRAASMERYGVAIANLATTMPEVLDVVDQSELSRQLARDLGVPPVVLRDEKEVNDLRAQRQEMTARAAAAEVAGMEAAAVNEMGNGEPTLGAE